MSETAAIYLDFLINIGIIIILKSIRKREERERGHDNSSSSYRGIWGLVVRLWSQRPGFKKVGSIIF